MRRIDGRRLDVPSRDRRGGEDRPRLNPVGDHLRVRRMKLRYAVHDHAGASDPFDLRSHRTEERAQRRDLGLARRVLDHGLAGGGHGRH